MTQGYSKEEALDMLKDAIMEFIKYYFQNEIDENFSITVNAYKKGVVGIATTNNKLILTLSLRRQREKVDLPLKKHRSDQDLNRRMPMLNMKKEKLVFPQINKRLLNAANPYKKSHQRIAQLHS